MPDLSLSDRFTFGQARLAYPDVNDATQQRLLNEILTESPNRQRAIISLAQYQVHAQERYAATLTASTRAGAQLVANEVSQRTEDLRRTLENASVQLSENIALAAGEVSSAINQIGCYLTIELSEIHWQIAQQNKTLDRILHTLQESRSNEARQLVMQGVRLYENEQYEKAEERFRRALDYDMTDYQVLMNLGFIEIHKGNAEDALKFFHDALALPPNLDVVSKGRTLWAIAVLESAQGGYEDAIRDGHLSLSYVYSGTHFYEIAVWAAQARRAEESVARLENAIQIDPTLFARAATDPGFEPIHEKVTDLLASLANNSWKKAKGVASEASDALGRISGNVGNTAYQAHLERVYSVMKAMDDLLSSPSYSSCVEYASRVAQTIPKLSRVAALVAEIDESRRQHDTLTDCEQALVPSFESSRASLDALPDLVEPTVSVGVRGLQVGCGFPLFAFGLLGLLSALVYANQGSGDIVLSLILMVGGGLLLRSFHTFILRRKDYLKHERLKKEINRMYESLKQELNAVQEKLKKNAELSARITKELETACGELEACGK